MKSTDVLLILTVLCIFAFVTGQNQPIFEKTFYVAEIMEEQRIGLQVLQLKASIVGGGGILTYRLDTTVKLFAVDQSSGWITVLGRLDREASDTRRFNAYAKNSGNNLESHVQVVVHLTDVNDNTPVFSNLPATVHLQENIGIGSVVFTVSASDADTSRNALLTFSIAKGNEEGKFAMDLYSGKISTKSELDFETTKEYNITIKVQDSGENSTNTNVSILRIKIKDHDDQPGKFLQSKYFATIPENLPKGSMVTVVKAVDLDSAINAPVYYDIEQDSNPGYVFDINSLTGVITVNGSIDRETTPLFFLRVSATSTIFNADYAMVQISISDVNDNSPLFLQPRYDVAALESVRIGSKLLKVAAQDKDIGINAEIRYSIVGGDAAFFVQANGDVILAKNIDREKQDKYTFVVVAAETKTAERNDASVPVHITVNDVNDNTPRFEQANYSAIIKENSPVGTSVITVKAKDDDVGDNAVITYTIVQNTRYGFPPFAINSNTGEIQTTTLLDREITPLYSFMVEASNSKSSIVLSAGINISVMIQDENDNSPVFRYSQYNAFVAENSPPNTFIYNVTAVDADDGVNSAITYSFTSGDFTKFLIDAKSGEIRNKVVLDREDKEKYELIVKSEDRRRKNGTTKLVINVIDVNDNAPKFDLPAYHFYVMEEIEGVTVGQVHAIDRDAGQNSNVTYAFIKEQENFSINPRTGILKCRSSLDYEKVQSYLLIVTATDNGHPVQKKSFVSIKVTVLDANDHKPVFTSRLYAFNVTENSLLRIFGYVHAIDKDSGVNGALHYRVMSGNENGDFALNSSSGALSLLKSLDREAQSQFVLIVSVVDNNKKKNSLEDLAAVRVSVLDENDNSPIFSTSSVSITIKEDVTVGSFITSVQAQDKDAQSNAEINYRISSGNKNTRFAVDQKSGRIFTRSSIDRDPPNDERYFELLIRAEDMGSTPRHSTAQISITVLDANDNKPEFSQAQYSVVVYEDLAIGSTVTIVNCTDKDSGDNGLIGYKLLQGEDKCFSIDVVSGSIKTTKLLDYDVGVDAIQLVVEASDSGTPPLKSTAKVLVKILNRNDNSPWFQSTGPFTFSEGDYRKKRQKVGQVKAYDNDLDAKKSQYGILTYTFLNMSSYDFDFYWPFNALSSPTTSKDRKSNTTAFLQGARMVTDVSMGSVLLLPGATQSVLLGDYAGDCISNPTLCTNGLTVSLWIKFEAGGFIISSGAQSTLATGFSFDFGGGHYRLRVATHTKEYEMKLIAIPLNWFYFTFTWSEKHGLAYYENGILKSTTFAVKSVLRTTDIYTSLVLGRPNDVSGSSQLYGRLYVGEVVIWRLRLQDFEVLHAFQNSERKTGLKMIHPSTYNDLFEIEETTGEIFVVAEIDRETRESYSLDIKVSDNDPTAPKSNYTAVKLFVSDVNDNAPRFQNRSFSVDVMENIPQGTNALKLVAVDIDKDANGKVKYSIDLGNVGNVFSIDASTGQLKTTGVIDRELRSSYTLQIAASDGGSPPRKSTAVVYITILDANDEFPTFTQNQYEASVKENLAAGQPVLMVKALDQDVGKNALITYSISSQYFSIDKNNGQISTTVSLDREAIAQHRSVVTAKDHGTPSKSSSTTVIVNIIDENDNRPKFLKASYYAVVAENRKLGSSVISVTATDADANENGVVKYSLTGDDGKFSIDSSTGTVKTVDSIDREKFSKGFLLKITATDQGTPSKSSTTVLRIDISDVNDNLPSFNRFSYRGSVTENEIGVIAVVVNATDADGGLAGEISYSITGGNSEGMFIVDNQGRIKTSKRLDRETKSAYELIVRATDRAGDPKYAEIEVDIRVIDANDNAPVIGKIPDNIMISEATIIDTQVFTVSATDNDVGSNKELSFFGSSPDLKFSIDTTTGAVKTISKFDHEIRRRHTFFVGCFDHGNPRLNSSMIAINFTVVDSNDNNPTFKPYIYLANVPENAILNTTVVKVHAYEKDLSARISYSITNGNQEERFSINNTTGLISVKGRLDREKRSTYFLLITASDNGTPPRLGHAYVTVTVMDVNDHPPKFKFKNYKIELAENVPIGTVVLQLSVTDPDSVDKTKLTYRIENGNIGDSFSTEISAPNKTDEVLLKTASNIDRETVPIYHLRISVSDGIHVDVVNVTVKITDVNDKTPTFNASLYTASVYENAQEGYSILRIYATDEDEGSNALIRYSFAMVNTKFLINEITGEITASKIPIDREKESSFTLICKATDPGDLSGYVRVQVNVIDQNDERPVFLPVEYKFELTEGIGSKGKTVAVVRATDADVGSNANIAYSIKSGNLGNSFAVNSHTGIIKSAIDVDREQQGLKYDAFGRGIFELVIQATDQGVPALSATVPAKVTVYVVDINDNMPTFPVNGFSVFISEGAAENENVTLAAAVDEDAGLNSALQYEIVAGNMNGDFKIIKDTGMIQTARKLERQLKFSYNLTVKASDQGSPPLSSQTTVQITIGDTNDNVPVFSQPTYFAFHLENSVGRTALLNVSAKDADRGQNAAITYSIIGGNSQRKFSILSKEDYATIFVDRVLDREIEPSYSLVLMAKDGGIPYSQTAFANVRVFVRDENDNSPILTQRSYSAKIAENSPPGTVVVLNTPIFATDADIGLSARVSYSVYGDDSKLFSIDQDTAVMKVKSVINQTLDYEKKKNYEFYVRAMNGKSEVLQSTAPIRIEILDLNDNTPVFSAAYYNTEIKESVGIGHTVIKLNAADPDSDVYGAVSYHIASGSEGKFAIDRNSGVVKTTAKLDRESRGYYSINISAIDGGLIPRIGECVLGITLIDVNDNAPIFSKTSYEASVVESVEIGTIITSITAIDKDEGEAGLVGYSLHSDTFRINHTTGIISTIKLLDLETRPSFDLIVTATDGKGVNNTATLSVTVLDVNDHKPTFQIPNPLLVDVFEGSANGSVVAIASAEDKDSGKNGRIEYTSNYNGTGLFKIDRETGVIRIVNKLDYYTLHQQGVIAPGRRIELVVNATDHGVPRLGSSTVLKINIIDINEKNPNFDSTIFYATIKENSPIRSHVIQVKATKNSLLSRLTYSFVVENAFFGINEVSGNITTTKILDREKMAKHILTIKVNDNEIPPRFGYTTVSVSLLDENDNPPKFAHPNTKMQIEEDAKIGAKVGVIAASDPDEGRSALVYYKFKHADIGKNGNMVSLDGICVEPLGMESQRIPSSQITSSSTRLEMNKDYSPTQARLRNSKYLQAGVQYQGAWCAGVSDVNQYLQVDLGTKKIITRVATQGVPQGSNYVTRYRITYSDDATTWKNVSKVFTGNSDADLVAFQDVIPDIRARFVRIIPLQWKNRICLRLELYGCNMNQDQAQIVRVPFQIDKKSGTINVVEPLDRERKEVYKIQIEAYDNGEPPMNTSMTLQIKLLDANDNVPVFSSSTYHAVIPENSIPGQQVLLVSANDSDVGENAKIEYSLAPPSQKFIIEATSGIVRVSGNIDYETQQEKAFLLHVKATDSGSPSLSSFSVLMINITDTNDNPPIFNQSEFKLSIYEGIPIGSVFSTLNARDKDEGENAHVTYGLLGGQTYFSIDNTTGGMKVIHAIDRESIAVFNLIVFAEDKGIPRQRSSAKLTIEVKDVNDHAPQFTKKVYSALLSERTNLGSMVMLVAATDMDIGSNGKVHYKIQHTNETTMFQMNPITGEILLRRALDRETRMSIAFNVIAEDLGSPRLSDVARVNFLILDENDNPPRFKPDTINIKIKEDVMDGSFLVKMQATDADIGLNSALSFSLVHGSDGKFKIDANTGVIQTSDTLDREKKNHYSIVVMASDKSATPLLGFATVKVTILDVNDNKPEFTKLDQPFYIMENMPNGTSVGQVFATDEDEGENAFIEYRIEDGIGSKIFQIDSQTGMIIAKMTLDRESQANYSINITARNTNASIPLSSSRIFTIQVLDTNDNAPALKTLSVAIISEAATIGTEIIKLVGTDADVGTNAKLTYNIRYDLSDAQADFVSINSKSGILVTRINILDREMRNVTIVVEVSDYGIPTSLNSTGTVLIQVEDVNDNSPRFKEKNIRSKASEGASIGSEVTSIAAFDKDAGPNAKMIYSIISGNDQGNFRLDNNTGRVTVAAALDRETTDVYFLNISARNELEIYNHKNKTPADIALLQINIDDVNDNAPFFNRKVFTGGVPANAKLNSYIVTVQAVDLDKGVNAAMSYDIISGNQVENFRIDSATGKIHSAKAFVGMAGNRFEMTISAKDNKGVVPFNVASNVTTARIYVLKESQRVWLVLGIDADYIENNKQEFLYSLSNITQSKVYLESLIKVFKNDGSTRSEIVIHCVNEDLGIIVEGSEVRRKIDESRSKSPAVFSKWKINQAESFSSGQASLNEMKTYQIALIVIGITTGLLLLFALFMVIRARRTGKVQKLSANDCFSKAMKNSRKRKRRTKRRSDDLCGTNQYEDWWTITSQTDSHQDTKANAGVDTSDSYLYESKINLLKQGMLGKRNRNMTGKNEDKHKLPRTMNRTVDNPVAVAGEQIGHENRSDVINDEDIEDRSFEDGNDQITSL